MKILFDHQIFHFQQVGGISRYFVELLKSESSGIKYNLSLKRSLNLYLNEIEHYSHILSITKKKQNQFPKNNSFKGAWRLKYIINKITGEDKLNLLNSISLIQEGDFDIFHPTYYDPYFLSHINKKPFVLTVYDMIHEIYSENFPINDNTSKNKKVLVEKADRIIAISASTKKDLVRIYNIPEGKVDVIYLANSLDILQLKKIYNLPERFLLFVGARGGYKNFEKFLISVVPLLKEDTSLYVVCTGHSFNATEQKFITETGISNKILQYFVTDKELVYLYRKAIAFVFPSYYEGFGIPVLEAMACGCPALLSNTSSLPEVGGDAAEYFDPSNKEDMYVKIRNVVNNKELQHELRNKGFLQEKKFSWQQCSVETKKVYSSVI